MAMEKTFDAGREEPAIYEGWERAGAFGAGAGAAPGAESFCIMIPPPNVTGSLHMGHAFNNTLQDILIRWKRMQGFDVLWQPGTDHAGIATQMVTEREMAANGEPARREMGREAFVRRVWQQKVASRGTIIGQLKRLGASCDWSREAFTMSGAPGAPEGEEGNFHDAVIRAFVELYNRGAIHRGKRLVNWDPHFETAISDLEVENVEVPGKMWHFKYPLAGGETYIYRETDADGNVTLEEERDYIAIATTRPETMLGDGAVAVHPSDERYAPIVGKLCEIPVGPKAHRRLIPIITDDYPDPEFGSGAVKITGAHDFNDYAVAERAGIPMYRLMDTKARMRDDGAPYAQCAARAQEIANGADFTAAEADTLNLVPDDLRGLDRFEARERVVAQITAEGLAVTVTDGEGGEVPLVEERAMMQPFGDRSKVVIEPMLTDQWFVDAAQLVQPAIDGVRRGLARGPEDMDARGKPAGTAILPEQDAKVYFNWLENIEPWCISRQLWWGHRIPVWYDEDGHQYCATSEAEAQAMVPGRTLMRDEDVLDTWFSSGIWPLATLGWPAETPELKRYFPTDVLITGFDIIFFWVARMMMMQHALVGERPFHTVYVHALVRDAEGKKMSKSLGNVLDPIELIDEFGADAVRFTLASLAAMGRDVKLSKDRIAGYRNFTTKLWNAARFAEMNGAVPDPDFDPSAVTETVNRWIIAETARARASTDAALEGFRFNDAANGLYAFVWGRVCDWYLEFAKPLLDGPAAAETRATLAWVIDQCLILLHPFMPYVTEALWGRIAARERMLILANWPDHGGELHAPGAEDEIGWIITLIEELRSARAELGVPAGARLDLRVVDLDSARRAALDRHRPLITRLARLAEVADAPEVPRGAVTVALEGGTLALPLAGHVDIAAETARLEKARAKLAKEIAGLEGRLANGRFLANAPEAVIEDTRAQARARADEAARLDAALARLAEAAS